MRDAIVVVFIGLVFLFALYALFDLGRIYQRDQQCTDKCQVKELELQKEIQELKWRYELVNDIKNK